MMLTNKSHMRTYAYIFILFALLWQTSPVVAQLIDKAPIAANIDRIITATDPNVNIGMVIVNLNSGQILYQRNPERTYIPASILKLFTSAAALIYFGADYTFSTSLLGDPEHINDGVLSGNITLKLSGDPSLSQENLSQLLTQLKTNHHINTIAGDFVIDTSIFNPEKPYGPGWMVEDTYYAYGTRLSPIILDQNQINLVIEANGTAGKPAVIDMKSPANDLIPLTNTATTGDKNADCKIKQQTATDNAVTISGCIALNTNAITKDLAIRDPLAYSEQLISQLLARQDIQLTGHITTTGKTPGKSSQLASITSSPLSQLVTTILKDSNNLFADAIFLKIGNIHAKSGGDWKASAQAVKQILREALALDLTESVIVDGSGLSRYNLLSPTQIGQLLTWIYHDFQDRDEFMAALPLAGKDGTLEDYPLNGNLPGYFRAKTGSMSGVINLAGYLTTQADEDLAFVIMISGFSGPIENYIQLIGNITDYLAKLH